MRIGMVLESKFPPDIRVEKEARSLIAAGYEVHLLARKFADQSDQETVNGIHVHRVTFPTSIIRRKINSLRFYLSFRNEFWRREMERFVDAFKIDALHVHDLPLVGTAIQVARSMNIPIVADLHENYPAALQVWRNNKRGLRRVINNKLFNLNRWTEYEKRCVREVDHVIVVVDEAKERLLHYGISGDKITVLMNAEDVNHFANIKIDYKLLAKYRDQGAFVVSYIGGFDLCRGLDTVIEATAYAREKIPSLRLLLIGAQHENRYVQALWELIKDYDLEEHVEIIGWQLFEMVPSYIQASDVCLVPHHRSPHTDSTIPHKLFQYMLMGKPVIVSDCRPLKRIVKETKSGIVFRSGDARDLAEKMVLLYQNEGLRKQYGQAGRKAVLDRYNWKKESEKLIELYRQLVEHNKRGDSS